MQKLVVPVIIWNQLMILHYRKKIEKSKGNIFIDTTPDNWKNSMI